MATPIFKAVNGNNPGVTQQQMSDFLSNYKNLTGGGSSQVYTDADYENAVNNDPILSQHLKAGNTLTDLEYASTTGDLSGMKNIYGQPFSPEEHKQALADAEAANKDYYDALKSKETADTESALAQKQQDYQDYLIKSGEEFQADKTTLDQNAAEKGVLFSGMRKQKEQNLQKTYEQDQASKLGTYGRDIGNIARDYQYAYGNQAAQGLNNYYKAGANTYNPNIATGGVGSSGLSSIYQTGNYNYNGTRVGEQAATANKGAAARLWNKGNKLLATGSSNQH